MAQHNHYGHRQRLKDRFLQTGFTGFDAHGILELLLFYSIPQRIQTIWPTNWSTGLDLYPACLTLLMKIS